MLTPRSQLRQKDVTQVQSAYPDRVIAVLTPHKESDPHIDKRKYVVPHDLSFHNFVAVARKRMKIDPAHALFFFLGNHLVPMSSTMSELKNAHGDEHGVLYVTYSSENTFGHDTTR